MSTRPGGHIKKKPAQKHKNTTAFKFDKYRTDPKAKVLKNLEVSRKFTINVKYNLK